MKREEEIYTVMSLSNLDVCQLDDDLAEPNKATVPKYERIYNAMSDEDKRWLADYICDWLWDYDQFQEALRGGLDKMQQEYHAEFNKLVPLKDIKLANE